MAHVKPDPELIRQLDAASTSDEPVEAVFSLRPAASEKFIPAGEAETRVHELLRKVGEEVSSAPRQVRVFRNLGSFALSAAAPFVRKLLESDEIVSATANKQPTSMFIAPVSSKPVELPKRSHRKSK